MDELEALAYKRAVAFALEIGLREVAFEGDSKVVLNNSMPSHLAWPLMVTSF